MKVNRKKYKADFKATVALETLKGDKTVTELSREYNLHRAVINKWKRQLME